jgi:hypothetical protein
VVLLVMTGYRRDRRILCRTPQNLSLAMKNSTF